MPGELYTVALILSIKVVNYLAVINLNIAG